MLLVVLLRIFQYHASCSSSSHFLKPFGRRSFQSCCGPNRISLGHLTFSPWFHGTPMISRVFPWRRRFSSLPFVSFRFFFGSLHGALLHACLFHGRFRLFHGRFLHIRLSVLKRSNSVVSCENIFVVWAKKYFSVEKPYRIYFG